MGTSSQSDRSGWWVAYFIAMALVYVASLIPIGSVSPWSLLASIFHGFGLVGLWGYLSDKAVGWRRFWVVYASLMILGAVIGLSFGIWDGMRNDFVLFIVLAVSAIFSVPQWVAIWRYAFRSPQVWQVPQGAA